jgi:hypothetical protein
MHDPCGSRPFTHIVPGVTPGKLGIPRRVGKGRREWVGVDGRGRRCGSTEGVDASGRDGHGRSLASLRFSSRQATFDLVTPRTFHQQTDHTHPHLACVAATLPKPIFHGSASPRCPPVSQAPRLGDSVFSTKRRSYRCREPVMARVAFPPAHPADASAVAASRPFGCRDVTEARASFWIGDSRSRLLEPQSNERTPLGNPDRGVNGTGGRQSGRSYQGVHHSGPGI